LTGNDLGRCARTRPARRWRGRPAFLVAQPRAAPTLELEARFVLCWR